MENSPSIPSLLCDEGLTSLHGERVEKIHPVTKEDDEYIRVLMDKEINGDRLQVQEHPNVITGNWIKGARADAVQYILNTRARFGFKVQTAYLAITYLDTYLARKSLEGEEYYWVVLLLAMTCLSLAAKMEEIHVPFLSSFAGDYQDIFDSKRIQRTELLVLTELGWRMQKLTPFAFTQFFASKFCQNSSTMDITYRAEEVIMVAIRANEKIMDHRPSTMAAATTLLITDRTLTREAFEAKINTLSMAGYLHIDNVFLLYNQMKELDMQNYRPSNTTSPRFSPVQLQRIYDMENSSASSARSAKRKSLTFTQCDQSSESRDAKRPS